MSESVAFPFANQTNLNFGIDEPSAGSGRETSYLLQGQFAILAKLVRLQSAFSALFGSNYLEGEGQIGAHIYLLTPFVTDRSWAHPFLSAMGTVGVGSLNDSSRLDLGYAYGAGIDLKFWRRTGVTLAVQQHNAKEDALRYMVGFFWTSQQ